MNNIIAALWEGVEQRSADYPDENFVIRGLWDLDIRFQPTPEERLFKYKTAIAQTRGQGSCYASPDASISLDIELFGRDARNVQFDSKYIEIAVLDAIYAGFDRTPSKSYRLKGDPIAKSEKRTEILVEEIMDALDGAEDPSLLNVGVLGNVLDSLRPTEVDVYATDKEASIVGTNVHGVTIQDADQNERLIADVDAALISGMTLSTNTLPRLLKTANCYDTTTIVFAETGANFAEEYCSMGADVTVSEPFPFYIFQGTSHIDIFYSE